jgi:spermidine synthase
MIARTDPGPGTSFVRSRGLAALTLLFFVSGISGLIYQVLWLRLLALVFGVTVYAASTVLASFMGGLALGSLAAGRFARRLRNPLRAFGIVELLIGVSALATPAALDLAGHAYAWLHGSTGGSAWLVLARFLCSFGVLLLPTSLMGATLPLVIGSSLVRQGPLGQRVGLLYGANTGGAIAGAVASGFFLIGAVGISSTFLIAAALNALVGTAAVLLSRTWKPDAPPQPAGPTEPAGRLTRLRALVLVVFALSGFTALAFEVVWFRVLVLFVPATTYAFTTMLAAVLLGISAGSLMVAPLLRRERDWVAVLACLEIAIGVVAIAALTTLSEHYEGGSGAARLLTVSLTAILPPALLMGMAFPIGARLWIDRAASAAAVARRTAILNACNLAGAIVGSIAAGFWLLPMFGSRASLIAIGSINLLAGLALAACIPSRLPRVLVSIGGAGAFAAAAAQTPDVVALALARRVPPAERLVWREEGLQTTVTVHVRPTGGRTLYLDGLHQANDSPDMVHVHRQIGLLPMLLHEDPRDALVIGLGGGATAGAVSQFPGVSLDIVELSGSVVRGASWFSHVNYDVVNRPNVRLRVDDGRNYLLLTRDRYDVVTADIIQPIHAGAGNLYSREYFELVRRVLRDDGLALQWVGHRSETEYTLIMRTFARVFPHITTWVNGTLMLGSTRPLRIDRAAFERRLADPAVATAAKAIGIASFDDLAGLYTGGPAQVASLLGDGPVLTDDRPLVEYHLSLPPSGRPDFDRLRSDIAEILASPGGGTP